MFAIDQNTGALNSQGTDATGDSPTGIAIDLSNTFTYIADSSSDQISSYNRAKLLGILDSIGTVIARDSPTGITLANGISPVKYVPKYAYVAKSGKW